MNNNYANELTIRPYCRLKGIVLLNPDMATYIFLF